MNMSDRKENTLFNGSTFNSNTFKDMIHKSSDQSISTLSSSMLPPCNGHRKSIPHKSPKWSDEKPGIIFKLHPQQPIVLMNSSGSPTPIAHHGPYKGSCTAFGITFSKTRSKSVSYANGTAFSVESPAVTVRRGRSNSLQPNEEEVDVLANCDMSDSEIPTNGINIPRHRKGSITMEGGPNSYTGSLSHLIPNRLLMTLSRRASVTSSADGCHCASCLCTITPYWRDGWADDVMLCNACGLRYQKFARRCPKCVYIPRKDDSLGGNCVRCGTPWTVG